MAKVVDNASSLIDNYINNASDFAQPILTELRKIIASADERLVEDWKWGAPGFAYEGLVCWLAAFKTHVGINFFKGALMEDNHQLFEALKADEKKNNRMVKFTSVEDIRADELVEYIRQAMVINESGVKPKVVKKTIETPDYFQQRLKEHPKAKEVFESFSYSNKKDYIEWITSAKREETRENRIVQSLEWLNEGKIKNWKYKKC